MKDRLTISIAMTTYNGERFLKEQLDSFLWQTRLPDELVVCDDGSTDRTLDILENFARTAPFPVKIFRNPQRLGFSKNFEKASLMCSGDLVAFSDQDDVWLPEKLEEAEKIFMEDEAIGIFVHDAMVVDENLQSLGFKKWDRFRKLLKKKIYFEDYSFFLKDLTFSANSTIMRKKILDNVLPIPSYWTFDKWEAFISIFYTKMYFRDIILIKYRHHPRQTAFRKPKSNYQKMIDNFLKNDKNIIYEERVMKWRTAINCLPEKLFDIIGEDIKRKINLLEIYKKPAFIKILSIFRYYILGYYHKYEHGTRSMLRDLVINNPFRTINK